MSTATTEEIGFTIGFGVFGFAAVLIIIIYR